MDKYISIKDACDYLAKIKNSSDILNLLFRLFCREDINIYIELYRHEYIFGWEFSYFYSEEYRKASYNEMADTLFGIYRLPPQTSSSYLFSILFPNVLSEKGESLSNIPIIEDLEGNSLILTSDFSDPKLNFHTRCPITPYSSAILFDKAELSNLDETIPKISKRQKSSENHQNVYREVIEAALYELTNNYEGCSKNGKATPNKIADAICRNSETHWPVGCPINKRSSKTKATPIEADTMADHFRKIINIKK